MFYVRKTKVHDLEFLRDNYRDVDEEASRLTNNFSCHEYFIRNFNLNKPMLTICRGDEVYGVLRFVFLGEKDIVVPSFAVSKNLNMLSISFMRGAYRFISLMHERQNNISQFVPSHHLLDLKFLKALNFKTIRTVKMRGGTDWTHVALMDYSPKPFDEKNPFGI